MQVSYFIPSQQTLNPERRSWLMDFDVIDYEYSQNFQKILNEIHV